jgi:hypothetical protein
MAYWPTNSQFHREQFFIARRNERYDLLDQYVFRQLSLDASNLAGSSLAPENLKLDNLEDIINSPHFQEAHEHFKVDLVPRITQPEELSSKINQYNKDVDEFLNQTIPYKIKQTFGEIPRIIMSTNVNDLPEHAILLPFMIEYLRKYWLSDGKNDMGTIYANGVLSEGQGIRALARISPDVNSMITAKIMVLKADRQIMSILNGSFTNKGLRSRRTDLILAAENLADYVEKNISYKIQIREYATVCIRCPTA